LQNFQITDEELALIQNIVVDWGERNYEYFPWRETENSFHALIAEMMLQRTKAEQVLHIYNEFVKLCPSLKSAKNVNESQLRDTLHSLGLNWRIDNIVKLTKTLSEKGHVPLEYNSLIRLPGVGPYVASAFLSFHTDQRHFIIDSNVVRLWGRVFGLETDAETRRKKWFKELVDDITPETNVRCFNYAILDITRTLCKPKPLCNSCPLNGICSYYRHARNERMA